MQNFELLINQNKKLVFEIDFELDKYANGDINVYLSHRANKILLANTQILYLSELFINVMSAVLQKKDESYCDRAEKLLDEYLTNLDKGDLNTPLIDWKILLDFQQFNGTGYMIFLYWNNDGNYLQIDQIKSENKKHSLGKNIIFEKITNKQIKIWIQSVSELKNKLHSNRD